MLTATVAGNGLERTSSITMKSLPTHEEHVCRLSTLLRPGSAVGGEQDGVRASGPSHIWWSFKPHLDGASTNKSNITVEPSWEHACCCWAPIVTAVDSALVTNGNFHPPLIAQCTIVLLALYSLSPLCNVITGEEWGTMACWSDYSSTLCSRQESRICSCVCPQ